jgi:hypothetical protein
MRKTLVVLTMLAGQAFAGGFYLQLGNPEASPEARKLGAVLTIQAAGCHDPATAKVTATAIGMVNGERRSVPLEVKAIPGAGRFALVGQPPKEGKWVVELVATNGEQFTNTIVAVGPDGLDRLHAKANMKKFDAAEIEGMLK